MFPKWLVLTYDDHWTCCVFNKYEWNFVNPFSSWENKCFSMWSNRTCEKPQEMHIYLYACWISIHTYLLRTPHFWSDLALGTSYMFNHHELFSRKLARNHWVITIRLDRDTQRIMENNEGLLYLAYVSIRSARINSIFRRVPMLTRSDQGLINLRCLRI